VKYFVNISVCKRHQQTIKFINIIFLMQCWSRASWTRPSISGSYRLREGVRLIQGTALWTPKRCLYLLNCIG